MPNEDVIVNRDYTDNFSYKQFVMEQLGEKYFPEVEPNDRTVGFLGFTLEQNATTTEDAFNTSSILLKEAFPNRAQIPDSIYSHAAIFQLDSVLATPAMAQFIIVVKAEEIRAMGTSELTTNGGRRYIEYIIDKDTTVYVDDIPFTLDYDIAIRAIDLNPNSITDNHNWTYTAQYLLTESNAMSNVTNPYLKIRVDANGFLGIYVFMHQCVREYHDETIVDNANINYPVVIVNNNNQMAGFDVFYRDPGDEEYEQIEKRLVYTNPLKDKKFCYYKVTDEEEVTITFSSRDMYFQPEFNSDLQIWVYSTLGAEGNFDRYEGKNIQLVPTDERYDTNSTIFMTANIIGGSSGGLNKGGLEALQALTVEGYRTCYIYSTENDIMEYFNNYPYRYGNEIKAIKKRDDLVDRLYSVYLIMRDGDYVFPTNTLWLKTDTTQPDVIFGNDKYIIKPGHLWVYDGESKDYATMIEGRFSYEDHDDILEQYDFVYTNPYLISINQNPGLVGMYSTIVNNSVGTDYVNYNEDAFIQFQIDKVDVTRGIADDEFTLTLRVLPMLQLKNKLVANFGSNIGNKIRIIILFGDEYNALGYVNFYPVSYDEDNDIYTFEAKLKTDDYVTDSETFRLLEYEKINNPNDYIYVDNECNCQIYVFVREDDIIFEESGEAPTRDYATVETEDGREVALTNHFVSTNPEFAGFVIVNKYTTSTEPVTFIKPLNIMRSHIMFSSKLDENGDPTGVFDIELTDIPLLKSTVPQDIERFNLFVTVIDEQYDYLYKSLEVLHNIFHLDLKFYNTHGRSKNFVVGDTEDLIDSTDVRISFDITVEPETDLISFTTEVKQFIKDYIEQINHEGYNNVYVSNLIRALENNFSRIDHLKFIGINDYDSDIQSIKCKVTDLTELTKEERRKYVPEMLVANFENISIQLTELN